MHQHFGIGIASQMKITLGQNLLFQLLIVGELTVEAKREPLVLFDVMSLKRLSVSLIVGSTGGIAHVANRGNPRVLVHQSDGFVLMIQVEHFRDGADIFVGVDQLWLFRSVCCHPGGQLSSILDFQKQSRNMPRNLGRVTFGCKPMWFARQMVNRRNTTFVKQIGQGSILWSGRGETA
jgi:hypothetical protein